MDPVARPVNWFAWQTSESGKTTISGSENRIVDVNERAEHRSGVDHNDPARDANGSVNEAKNGNGDVPDEP